MLQDQNIEQSFNQAMPINVKPYKHQATAFLFALKVFGYIPDENISSLW